MKIKIFLQPLLVLHLVILVSGRIHHLEIHNDNRKYIPLSSFGFYNGGKILKKPEKFVHAYALEKSLFPNK